MLIGGFSFRVVSHLGFTFKPCDGRYRLYFIDINNMDNLYDGMFVFQKTFHINIIKSILKDEHKHDS